MKFFIMNRVGSPAEAVPHDHLLLAPEDGTAKANCRRFSKAVLREWDSLGRNLPEGIWVHCFESR